MEDNKNPFQEEVKETEENKETEDSQEETQEKKEEEQQEEDFEAKYEDLNNKYLRLAADFDNFRKRTIQEKDDLSKFATIEVLRKLTSVLDTFDIAQEQL